MNLPATNASALAVVAPPARLWRLPERGLAVFYGHPDTPRLFHYFLPRLIAQGKSVMCLDGGNRFDPLLVARFARSRGVYAPDASAGRTQPAAAFNDRLRVARAFTCFQLTELLVRAPRLLATFSARVVIVTALPDLYFDEDVREPEAAASFRRALEALRRLRRLPLSIAIFSDAGSFTTPRKKFFARLLAEAQSVSRFALEEGDRLSIIGEKPAPPLPRVLPSRRIPWAAPFPPSSS